MENAATFGSLGFYGFSQGVQQNDMALLNESAEFTRRAIALDPTEPIYRYNLAVSRWLPPAGSTRRDRPTRTRSPRSLYVDLANTTLRGEPFVEERWLAGALTDLEIVRRYRPDLENDILAA